MRIDRGDGADNADGRPDDTDAPEAQAADRAGPEPGDESAPEVRAIPAERTIAYRDKAEAVYRAYTIDQGCAEVEKIETDTVTPAMLRIEAEDSTRRLVVAAIEVDDAADDAARTLPAAELVDDRVIGDLRWHSWLLRVVRDLCCARWNRDASGYLLLELFKLPLLGLRGDAYTQFLVGRMRLLFGRIARLSVELNLE